MTKADEAIERLYPPGNESFLEESWKAFTTLHPDLHLLRTKVVKRVQRERDPSILTVPLRNCFFPDAENDKEIQELFRRAMNRGITALNTLCDDFLGEEEFDFRAGEVPAPLDLVDLVVEAREKWISARHGRHPHDARGEERVFDYEAVREAYEVCRAYGFGRRVLMIDGAPEVLLSRRHYALALRWFQEFLGFEDQREESHERFQSSWNTRAGVRVFGGDKPFSSRLKILNPDGGIKYSSLLMKMSLKKVFFEGIGDYTGVEFIVEDDDARASLVRLFSYESTSSVHLEDFKDTARGRVNPDSSSDFRVVKFRVRPAIPVHYSEIGDVYERIPVEVQILTLQDDEMRIKNPDVAHEAYKKKQFMQVFPVWFPQQIYEPLIRGFYA